MIKKKRFLLMCVLALWVFAGAGATAMAAQSPQIPLNGKAIPKYVNQLPLLTAAGGTMTTVDGNGPLTLRMCEFKANVLPAGAVAGYAGTWVFGYLVDSTGLSTTTCADLIDLYDDGIDNGTSGPLDTYIGPVIVNARGAGSTNITFVNNLPRASATNVLAFKYGTDQTLHWGDPLGAEQNTCAKNIIASQLPSADCQENYLGRIPAVPHLHGGEVPPELDGGPDAWWIGSGSDFSIPKLPPLPDGTYPLGTVVELTPVGVLPFIPDADNYPEGTKVLFTGDNNLYEVTNAGNTWTSSGIPPSNLFEVTIGNTWTSYAIKGHAYYSASGALSSEAIYKYPNTQEASPIWFHDHVLGITRLNVFAGLAGAYLIHDPALTASFPLGLDFAGLLNGPAATGGVEFTVPLVIQDRMFDTNGQLFYQSDSAGGVLWATNPEHPYWTPEFLGDVIVVNGKAWPNLTVEPKRYRFWLINGSNARTYELKLIDPSGKVNMNLYVIATDGGYLDAPVMTNKLVIMPGERYEVIIDFQGFTAGATLQMKNSAKSPYPAGAPVVGATTGSVMQFTIGNCASTFCGPTDLSYNPAALTAIRTGTDAIVRLPGTPLGPAIVTAPGPTQNVQKTRLLTLNEVMGVNPNGITDPFTFQLYPGGPLEVLVNNTKYDGSGRTDFPLTITLGNDTTRYSELPEEGSTEVWEIANMTADAHPIHLHLVQFQIINRQNFDIAAYLVAYGQAFPAATGFDPICTGAVFCPGYGPPSNPSSPINGKLGGNPDIEPFFKINKKQLFPKVPPLPEEAGWKDTVVAYPGQVTRLAVRWAPTDLPTTAAAADRHFPFDPNGTYSHGYVWHCHIIDHEDNEMMRPFSVTLNTLAPIGSRPLRKGFEY